MGRSLNEQAARARRWRTPALALIVLGGLILLSGCSEETVRELKALGLPEAVSTSADHMFALWIGSWIAAGIIGVFVWGLMIWAVIRYRRRSDDEVPTQIRYHLPLEVLYTVVPFVIIFVLFYHTVVTQDAMLKEKNPEHEIIVVGQQWSWTFNHLGADGRDPEGAGESGNDVFTAGTTAEPPELWLPVDKRVKFTLRSVDVIHSFWVPAFYFKMDVIPGRENAWVTTPTKEGVYEGRCAELCGVYHSRMLFTVRVVSQEKYDAHLADLAEQGNTGVALGKTDVDEIVGLEPENGGGE